MGRQADPAAEDVLDAIAGDRMLAMPPAAPTGDVADRIAALVASWQFPVTLLALVLLWIVINVAARPFEPYPVIVFAVLSAVLATLAALQGPIILRVQRRQQQRDRARDDADHAIALKSELELRYVEHQLGHVLERLPPQST